MTLRLVGYAAVFGQLSGWIVDKRGRYREQVARGAFTKSLSRTDVPAVIDHDDRKVLGCTRSGTLQLREDDHGLRVTIAPADSPTVRALVDDIERRRVRGMSFRFSVLPDDVEWSVNRAGDPVRTLTSVRLLHVSTATNPAYPQTEIRVERTATRIQSSRVQQMRMRLELAERVIL